MKKNMLTIIFATVIFALQACHKISGDGPVITRTYSNTGFSSVCAGIDGDVYYTQDSVYKVVINAQANILDNIDVLQTNGELQIQFAKFKNIGRHDRITMYVSGPSINGLGINGSGKMYALQPIHSNSLALKVDGSGGVAISSFTGNNLSAEISGSGDMQVNGGSVSNEALHISGSGSMDFAGVKADNVTTNTSGSGTMHVYAVNTLYVNISGSGTVFCLGNPSIYSHISGSGRVISQ